jgi:hypothetical protein
MQKIGPDLIRDWLRLKLADRKANKATGGIGFRFKTLLKKIREIEKHNETFTMSDLKLTGYDLMGKPFYIIPGPMLGEVKKYLFDKVVENPKLNESAKLRRLAGKFLKKKRGDK